MESLRGCSPPIFFGGAFLLAPINIVGWVIVKSAELKLDHPPNDHLTAVVSRVLIIG